MYNILCNVVDDLKATFNTELKYKIKQICFEILSYCDIKKKKIANYLMMENTVYKKHRYTEIYLYFILESVKFYFFLNL